MVMNENTSTYEIFENLLSEKKYEDLSNEELQLALEYVSDHESYQRMQQIHRDAQGMFHESNATVPPIAGADEVWKRYQSSTSTSKSPFYKRHVSIWWPSGIAAAMILSLWLRIPPSTKQAQMATVVPQRIIPITSAITDTIIKQVPVYIHSGSYLHTSGDEQASIAENNVRMVFVPPVTSVSDQINRRQGTNLTEMGELAKLTVSLP